MVSNYSILSDDILAVKIRDDDKSAFKYLYDRYNKKLYYFSLRYYISSEEAEEMVQSIFISIWEHRKSLDAGMSVRNFLYRSAVNYIYNYLKKKAIREKFIRSEIQKGEPQTLITYDQIFYHDLERSLNRIVETLPSEQQKIFKMSRFDGFTHEEIACRLNLSVRTVENQIYRALKMIKSKMNGEILIIIMVLGNFLFWYLLWLCRYYSLIFCSSFTLA
jgi:RNA polymerase sigma-70 factor, ECF subfamily